MPQRVETVVNGSHCDSARRPRLSVVVACVEADRTVDRCLEALGSACAGVSTQVVLACSSDERRARELARERPAVLLAEARPGALVPELWAAGLHRAEGEVVAFTIGNCYMGRGWATALLREIEGGAKGVGGPIELDEETGPLDWAIYFLRYSAFMPPQSRREIADVAGDNAAYARSSLERHGEMFRDGFWEVELHREIRAASGHLILSPEAHTSFGRSGAYRTMLRHRFRHGRHSGRFRTATGVPRWRSLAAAPLVPFVLALRILRRLGGRPGSMGRYLACLPALIPLAVAWALGEAAGAWSAEARE